MSYTFIGEFMSNAEWAINPDTAKTTISDELWERLPTIAALLVEQKLNVAILWYGASYEFFKDENDDDEIVPGGVPFEPEYRVEGCHVNVYADGEVGFTFPLKHSSAEGFMHAVPWTDAVKDEDGSGS